MSDTAQENDPSIEEILASIRQIISDDDDDKTESEPESEEDLSVEEPVITKESEDVLKLTDKVEPEPILSEPEALPEPESEEEIIEEDDNIEVDLTEPEERSEEKPSMVDKVDTELMSKAASSAALAGFSKLARDIQVARTHDGITLEDVVRAQLEPLLREWLDKNLPPMIEVLVEKELEKLSKKVLNS